MFFKAKIACAIAIVFCLCAGSSFSRNRAQQASPDSSGGRSRFQEQQKPSPTPSKQPDDDGTVRDDDVVRVDTDLTNIVFSAVDQDRRFVTSLKKEDIRVLEDGQEQQIFTFARQTELPLSLAILVDCSISEERTLPVEKEAASAFVDAVLRPNKDEVAVLTFTGEATLELGMTGNTSRVRRTSSDAKIAAITLAYTTLSAIEPDWSTHRTTSHSCRRRWFFQK